MKIVENSFIGVFFVIGVAMTFMLLFTFFHELGHVYIFQKYGVEIEQVVILGYMGSSEDSLMGEYGYGGWVEGRMTDPNIDYTQMYEEHKQWECIWLGFLMGRC